jgi:chaperonin GroES
MIQPLHDLVFIKRIEKEEGLIVTQDKEPSGRGEVVAVGTGRILEDGSVRKLDVVVGDEVLIEKHAGAPIDNTGIPGDIIVMREDDILGVFNG